MLELSFVFRCGIIKFMNKRLFGLQDVSRARNFIYGIAIVWIVFFHSGLRPITELFGVIKSYGDCGVEIFFLLSGICLFYSYDNDRNVLSFYKRRAAKILPPYIIVYGIVFLWLDIVSEFNVWQFLLDYSLLDFWLHGLGRAPWFVAAIMVFYVAYPLIYNVFFGEGRLLKIPCLILTVAIAMVLLVKYCPHLNIFTVRIPIFIVGCALGKCVHGDCSVKLWQLLLIALLFVGSVILFMYTEIWWIRNVFYMLLSLVLILILSQAYMLLVRFVPIIRKSFLGKLTLEIYLCHEKIQESLLYVLRWCGISVEFFDRWYQCLCIVLTIVSAYVVNKAVFLLFKRRKKEPING